MVAVQTSVFTVVLKRGAQLSRQLEVIVKKEQNTGGVCLRDVARAPEHNQLTCPFQETETCVKKMNSFCCSSIGEKNTRSSWKKKAATLPNRTESESVF